jgi:hypothetical protein
MAICSEAGELADLFLWERTPDNYRVSLEMADIAIYLLSLADVTGINLAGAIEDKLIINGKNYPAVKFTGNCEKKKDETAQRPCMGGENLKEG